MKTHDNPTKPIAGGALRHWCGTALRSSLAAIVAAVTVSNVSNAQTYFSMGATNFTEDFADIANATAWPNGFASGEPWSSVAVNATGGIPSATRTTTTTATFATSSSGGVQRGTENIQLLSTGATDNSSSAAIDLNLNFSGREAGNLSFDAATVFNSAGNRAGTLRVYYTVNGTVWTELTGGGLPYAATNNVAGSAAVSLALPTAIDGQAATTLRFYYHNGTGGTTGSRPKISIDNVLVTAEGPPVLDVDPPVIVTTLPLDNATGVALNTTLAITFDEPVVAETGNIVLYETGNPSPVATLPTSSAAIVDSVATFTLPAPLQYSKAYHVLLDSGSFKDASGNIFTAGISDPTFWNFGTLDPTPIVVSRLPVHEATDVVGDGVVFAIQYDRNVAPGTGTIQVVDAFEPTTVIETFNVANAAEVSVAGNLLSTVVPLDLAGGATYAVLVPAGAVVTADAAVAPSAAISGIQWIFTTVIPDETSPAVVSLSPSNGEGGAPVSSPLKVTFDEDVSLGTGPWTIDVLDLTNAATGFTITSASPTGAVAAGNQLIITPPTSFTVETDYRVTLSAGVVKDLAGNTSAAIGGVGAWEFTTAGPFVAGNVVISQVYGGGGNSGATFTHDFIELHNKSDETVFINDWSVQYASTAGSTWTVTPLSGSIPAGGYFLVQQSSSSTTGSPLPTPDATGSIAMSANNGKIALVGSLTALSGSNPSSGPTVSDFVGYGTANAFEGTGATPAISATLAAIRKGNGSIDTNSNTSDFVTGVPAPRNSASPPFVPTVDGSGVAVAVNAVGAFSNLPLFQSAATGQTLAVTVTGTDVDTVTNVTLAIPADFGVPLVGNVSLSGPAAATASAIVSGQSIIVSGAAVTTANALTITVSGLTAPDASIVPSDTGVRTIGVLTSQTGGTPTTIVAPPTVTSVIPVATVAALRALPTSGIKTYLLQPQVIVTYATPAFRNQHWVQDSTAGIVIDDPASVLTPFAAGSGVTGLVGKLTAFNGLLQLTPSVNAGALTSTGNNPAPILVNLADLIADPIAYQARLIRVNGVVFTTPTGNLGEGIEHPIALATNGAINFKLRTFFDTGYETSPVPTVEVDLIGLIQTRNVTLDSFISPRSSADIIPVAPPAGGYDDWADLYAGGGLPLSDFDNDGVSNLMEYFYGVTSVGFTPTPQIVSGAITWPRDSSLTDVTFKVRTSTNLVVWSDANALNVDLSNPDFITYTLPPGPAPFFIRLEVTQVP